MEQELFDDLVVSCKEAIEYEKGNIELKSKTLTVPDDEIEMNQVLVREFTKLSSLNKEKTLKFVSELLQASNG